MEGVATKQALVDRYNEIAANYTDETADEMSRLQDEIEAQGLWDLDSKVDQAMDALRCPDPDAKVETLSGGERRRVALCKLLLDAPESCCWTNPPTISTRNRSNGSNIRSGITKAASSW